MSEEKETPALSTTVPDIELTSTEPPRYTVFIDKILPEKLRTDIRLPAQFEPVKNSSAARVQISFVDESLSGQTVKMGSWVFALVAPFPTISDGISSDHLTGFWKGSERIIVGPTRFLVSEETEAILTRIWGESETPVFVTVPENEILWKAWQEGDTWAIIPFDQLDPRWKVLRIDGISPLDADFKENAYFLSVSFGIQSNPAMIEKEFIELAGSIELASSNRDPARLTSVIMTGTTALVRYTALKMEENGVLYPAEGVVDLLKDANFTHISNEVPFYEDCPPAMPVRVEQRFCSDPSYLELIDFIDADLIELTGNHILDWGAEPFLYTIQAYEDLGIPYFGGGKNLEDARAPLEINHNGTQLVFLGCSPAGPNAVWATNESAGSNPCDWNWLTTQINSASDRNALSIITFQHLEVEDYVPHSSQRIDFLTASETGAVIVSGSQSHFPQTMTFSGGRFIHYGLGNLFFDQMYGDNRSEFVDKHYFYNGKYISTELITLLLEDFARPRRMTEEERSKFLQTIFDRCIWESAFLEE